MSTTHVLAFGLGLLVGWQLLRASETACCKRVSAAVRDEVKDRLGTGAAVVGDIFNVWGAAPGILDALGVQS